MSAKGDAEVLLQAGKAKQAATISEVSTDVSSMAAAQKAADAQPAAPKTYRDTCTMGEVARLGKEVWDSPAFLKVMLGLSPGAVIYFYLASIGYFSNKFDNPALFSMQVFVSAGAFFAVSVLMQNADQMEREMEAEHGMPFMITVRFVFTGFLMSALTMLVPFCTNIGHVLVLGMSLSLILAYVFNSALDLATAIDPSGGAYVQIGYVLGGLLVVPTAWATGFGPGCTDFQVIVFYAVPAGVVAFTSLFYALHHYSASRRAFSSQASGASSSAGTQRGASTTADVLPQAYQSMKYGSMVRSEQSSAFSCSKAIFSLMPGAKEEMNKSAETLESEREFAKRLAHNTAMKFFVWLSFLPQVFFTLMNSENAQSYFLIAILGSVIGRFIALWHTKRIESQGIGESGMYRFTYSVYMTARWALVCCVIRYMLLKGQGNYQPSEDTVCLMIFTIWATGCHIHGVADIDGSLSAGPAERKPVLQWLVTAANAGYLAGLIIGCVWMALLTEEAFAAPGSAAAVQVGKAALVGLRDSVSTLVRQH